MSFEDVSRDWQRLGADDPLWAVYVAPGTRGGRWDVADFLATGRREVDAVLGRLDRLGLHYERGAVLDFGCGVGRLSNALATHFDEVVAVDVAPAMVERGRELDRSGGRIRWVLNTDPDLRAHADGSVDVAYSSLVLQHLPPDLATGYLREMVRVLRPGGLAVVQTVSRPRASLKGLAFRVLPARVLGWAQRRILRYPAPMRMTALDTAAVLRAVEGTGAELVDVSEDATYGGHWVCQRYVLRAPPASAAGSEAS